MSKLLFCLSLLTTLTSFSQVNFQSLPLDDALAKARAEGKFIFLQVESATCEECNNVANKAFENNELAAKMEQLFVCLKADAAHPDRERIASTYSLKSFGTLFLDNNGTLLHSFPQTTTFYKEYLTQIEKALSKAGEVLQVSELEKEYKNGNRSYGFLELLLQKRKTLYISTDALLDEYIDALPPDSLKSQATLVFIAKMAPMLDSKADRALRSNQALFNRAWYSMPLSLRSSINTAIIYKGMDKAIKEKNEQLAMRIAYFAQGSHNTNPAAGAMSFDRNMLRYYDEIKDTSNYFRKSIAYYERWYLSVSPDSIRRNDSISMKRMFAGSKKDTLREGNKMKITSSVAFTPTTQRFARELNNGAYGFYLRTANPYLLSIATEWSERSLAFFETPEGYNTYAKLLYKQGQKDEALKQMQKAVVLQQQKGFPTKTFDTTISRMKAGTVLTD